MLDPEAFSIVGLRVQLKFSTGKASELLLLEVIVMSPGLFCASFRKRPAEITRSRDAGLTDQAFAFLSASISCNTTSKASDFTHEGIIGGLKYIPIG